MKKNEKIQIKISILVVIILNEILLNIMILIL